MTKTKRTYRAQSIVNISICGRRVEFSGDNYTYSTADEGEKKELDELVENGFIALIGEEELDIEGEDGIDGPVQGQNTQSLAVFEDVTTYKQAREALNKDPYNIPFSNMSNKESVLEVAKENGVSFPNLD